ncbi:MAG TPA: phosphoglucosamine mutase [Patescibacteria group bacterium]|nr:phosphoglucosamine mutase [Patescibacteria group bacterium]
MGRLFGTDGIRGIANVDLRPPLAYALGRAVAHELTGPGGALVVGQDTRRSGGMLVAAISAGAASLGTDVWIAGVLPTPALAFLAGSGSFAAGIMVSASHNPADDNGLKVLDSRGLKLDEPAEDTIEQLIWRTDELGGPRNAGIGRIAEAAGLAEHYREDRRRLAAATPCDLHIVLDCANGAGGATAPDILAATGARVDVIHNEPDGDNINDGCGATAPGSLAAEVVTRGADLGFALDGDADRLVVVDRHGHVVDGDQLLGVCALDRLARGALPGGILVVTVLSNGGLDAALAAAGGRLVRTPVGDRSILEGMQVTGAGLGGEKSGHVIILEHATAGDGVVTGLEILAILGRAGRPIDELTAAVPLFPQEQRAVPARRKEQWEADPVLGAAIAGARDRLGAGGRVLVRPSGTEPALRVMIEGGDPALVRELADELAALAGERLH